MFCFNHISKNGTLFDLNISFRDKEFVCISFDDKNTKEIIYKLFCGIGEYDDGDILINGFSTRSFKQKQWSVYRKVYVGTTKIYDPDEKISTIIGIEMAFLGIGKKKGSQKIRDSVYQIKEKINMSVPFSSLSPYMQWLIRLSKAVVKNPDIVLIQDDFDGLSEQEVVNILQVIHEIADERLVILFSDTPSIQQYADRYVHIASGSVSIDTVPFTIDTKVKGNLFLPKANVSLRLLWELTKKYYNKHFIQGLILVLLVLIPLWFKRGIFICAPIAVFQIFAYHTELRMLKQNGATVTDLIEIVLFQIFSAIMVASIICLVFGKLDLRILLLFGAFSFISSIIYGILKLR